MEKKLSLPISIVSPGKPTLTKGPASDPLPLVTKSSIRRRFWAHDPNGIHHSLHGIHPNLGGIQYDPSGIDRNQIPLNQKPQGGKQRQLQARKQYGGRSMASNIVAELKRDNFAG